MGRDTAQIDEIDVGSALRSEGEVSFFPFLSFFESLTTDETTWRRFQVRMFRA